LKQVTAFVIDYFFLFFKNMCIICKWHCRLVDRAILRPSLLLHACKVLLCYSHLQVK